MANYQNATIAQLLQAIIGQINFDGEPISNIGNILLSILENTPYEEEPKSVLADLFLKLKAKLEDKPFESYEGDARSVIAQILLSILNETEYTGTADSRIAQLLLELKAELESYAELTAEGAIANFTTSVEKPLVNLTAYFMATQEAGTPTPQSPKTISGISADNVFQRGSNLFDISNKTNGKALKWGDGDTFNDIKSIISDYIEVKEGVKFTSNYMAQWCCYDKNKNYLGNILSGALVTTSGADRVDNTIPSGYGIYYLRLGFRSALNNNEDMTEKTDVVLSVGNVALPFETYNGNTTLISLGGTYYGGEFSQDKNGHRRVKVTMGFKTANDLDFRRSNNGGQWAGYLFYAQITDRAPHYSIIPKCNKYKYVSGSLALAQDLEFLAPSWSDSTYIYIRDDRYTTTEDFINNSQDLIIVYELAEPYEIDLPDGIPISSFNGVNNIFNDSGDSKVIYLARVSDNLERTAKSRAEEKAEKEKLKEIDEGKIEEKTDMKEEKKK